MKESNVMSDYSELCVQCKKGYYFSENGKCEYKCNDTIVFC